MGIRLTPSTRSARPQSGDVSVPVPGLPAWVAAFGASRFRQASARFCGALAMDILTFQQQVVEAYRTVLEELAAGHPSHLVRFWAFLPGIHDDLGVGLDRYMAFNGGRYAAFATHFGRSTPFSRSVPTASAVGVQGDEFVLYALAAAEPGMPVENPRQVPAYEYSRRFGPLPPCFARGTLLGDSNDSILIVGGTASIVGEESLHVGHLAQQASETFRNLAGVVASAAGVNVTGDASAAELEPLLSTFRDLRIYHPRAEDEPAIVALARASFPASCRIELAQASLCRSELLIEIEGLATLPPRLSSSRSPVALEP
jgi:chorismate lyase/3-hydroxybenzoate synthase